MQLRSPTFAFDFLYDASGRAVGMWYENANGARSRYFYERNLQGDIVAIVNNLGEIRATYTYDAWGNCTVTNAPGYGVGTANPIRYRGYYQDTETGFYFLQTRYYDPEVKRFINADCLFVAGNPLTGSNMYAYCSGNPVMRVDPTGMASGWAVIGQALVMVLPLIEQLAKLPQTLHEPIAAAIDTISYAFAGLDIEKMLAVINLMAGNLKKLNGWIGEFSNAFGFSPEDIGNFLNTGINNAANQLNIREWFKISFVFGDILNSLTNGLNERLTDPERYDPRNNSWGLPFYDALNLVDMIAGGQKSLENISAAYEYIRNTIAERGWSLPIDWVAFILQGTTKLFL